MRRGRAVAAAVAVALAVALVATLTGCTSGSIPPPPSSNAPSSTPSGDGVLRVGTLLPSTGSLAFLGAAPLAGVKVAVREINAAGGVLGHPVELVSADSGDATTKTAEASFASLVDEGADVIIGPASSGLAERLLPLAAAAQIPLVSPAATYPQLTSDDRDGWFFRTVPAYGRQGGPLGTAVAASTARVVLITGDDQVTGSIVEPLTASLTAGGGEVVATIAVAGADDPAAVVAKVTAATPDAVVLATADNGAQTQALITALVGAGFGGAKLWLTSQNTADYSQALPAGTLDGVNGIIEGAADDAAFTAQLRQDDAALGDLRYAAEAHDATVLAALAAVLAGDDGGASIAADLGTASVGGVKCISFAECLSVLATDDDVDYDGVAGPVNLDRNGDPTTASYGLHRYGAANTFVLVTSVTG